MKMKSSRKNKESLSLAETVRAFSQAHRLWKRGDRILAAVSGGPDSLALLLVLHELSETEGFSLCCAVVNHHLREEAAEEARFVAQKAKALSVPCRVLDADVPLYRKQHGDSVETAARILRYEALRGLAKEWDCNAIALAHHKDDQAETVLLHLLRGSGLQGLTGMQARRDGCIRPFLCVSKKEILDFLETRQEIFCHDKTNDVPNTDRNRIRLELLPALSAYNPQVTEVLCRTAAILTEDEAFLEESAAALDAWVDWDGDTAKISVARLLAAPLAMRRRFIRRLWERIGGLVPSFAETEDILAFLARGETGQQTSAAGTAVLVSYGEAWIRKGSTRKGTDFFTDYKEKWTLTNVRLDHRPEVTDKSQLVLDADQVGEVLLRTRKTGDRFAPPGMDGTKTMAKYMKELHIPAPLRDSWPLVADENHIYWIGGKAKSRYGRPTIHTKHYLLLTLRRT